MTLPVFKHSFFKQARSFGLNGWLAKGRSPAGLGGIQQSAKLKPDGLKSRGARQPNEIDFWRGFALITIFIDHIPGIFFEAYTYRHFGISDAAELFVFLAGWSLRLVVRSQYQVFTFSRLLLHLGGRALLIYLAQILITTFALAITAAAALMLDAPNLLEWNNAATAFQDPVPAHLGTVLLTYQLGFFDILPLYVVLMFAAPLIAIINHYSAWLLLPLSLTLYTLTLVTGFNLPTWPIEGRWFFNPMAWQFMFVLGFLLAEPGPTGKLIKDHPWVSRAIVLPILLIGIWIGWTEFEPDPLDMPAPHLFFTFDKTFLTPMRIIHLLCLTIMFGG
ncbi:MAG: hypothetical protein EBY21_05680, partial [Alphaproteobacteria bacterium]|nr:hypothetical protein [Alphaproteobacteria bacterium]